MVKIPDTLLHQPISSNCKIVMAYIYQQSFKYLGLTVPFHETDAQIGTKIGMNKRSVHKAIKYLIKHNFMNMTKNLDKSFKTVPRTTRVLFGCNYSKINLDFAKHITERLLHLNPNDPMDRVCIKQIKQIQTEINERELKHESN